MKNSKSLRVIFFGIGLSAVVALTIMNVVSLYELRESAIDAANENKKNQIEDFTRQVAHRFYKPASEIRKIGDLSHLQKHYNEHGTLPGYFLEFLAEAAADPLFESVYFSPYSSDHCVDDSHPVFRFNPETGNLLPTGLVPKRVCDGLGLARTQVNVLLDDYRWNNKVTFDINRSMTVSLINVDRKEAIGHLTFIIDRDYLVNDYLADMLVKRFGPAEETGIIVWLRDFMVNEILAASEPGREYSRNLQIDIRQRFPDFLENWVLHAVVLESPTVAASNASLTRNLLVLGFAVLALLGALIFMYFTAKRERDLAQRQAGFLANVTHEFKTPLATMQAAGENLSDGRVTNHTSIRTYGNHIYNESIRLKKMIEKLLDIARIDSGQTTVQRAPQKPELLLRHHHKDCYNYVTSKGFRFDLEVERNLPDVILDGDHFETILGNLIDNAIKYSFDEKHIKLKAERRGDYIVFTVTDRGIGIPKKLQKQIFRKFYRIEDTLTARTKGHGLGLSIVENLVRLNHGEISVESSPGEGTSFILKFPVAGTNGQTDHAEVVDYQKAKAPSEAREYVVE